MHFEMEWDAKPTRVQELLKEAFLFFQKQSEVSDDTHNFVISLPLEKCLDMRKGVREYLVCCLAELIRVYKCELPIELELILDLFTVTLPGMIDTMPEEVLGILRIFQWYNFAECLKSIDSELYASNWLIMCDDMSISEDPNIINALPTICIPAVEVCPISNALDRMAENPSFWKSVVSRIHSFPDRLGYYFDSALEKRDPIFDAHLFCTIALSDPKLLGDYRMPILSHWSPRVRVEAVRAYAKLDPCQEWRERYQDRDIKVRRQWAQSAAEIGYYEKNTELYSDPDSTVRYWAYSVPPLTEAKPVLFKLLKHPNEQISRDAFLAYGQLSTTAVDFEVLIRFMARNFQTIYDSLSVLRLVLNKYIEYALQLENPKSQQALLHILNHTLKFHNAISSYSKLEKESVAQKAVSKWLDMQCKDWEPFEDFELDEYSSHFKLNAVPLVSAEWVLDHADGNEFAQSILINIATRSPALIHQNLPAIRDSTPKYLLTAMAIVSSKFPRKVVNPTTTILRDICLQSEDSSWEAAEILYYGSQSFFKVIAEEILDRALHDPTENTVRALIPVSRVMKISGRLSSLATMSFVSPVYAEICNEDELNDWVPEFTERADTHTRSQVLLVLSKRRLATKLLPYFAIEVSDEVGIKLAEGIRSKKVPQRLAPLLFFTRKYEKNLSAINIDDVYSCFGRLVYILAAKGDSSSDTSLQIIDRFLECFATAENYSNLLQLGLRLKHFELKDFSSSLDLYVISELAVHAMRRFGALRGWKEVEAKDIKLPADSFAALPLGARELVMKTSYLDQDELEQLPSPKTKRPRLTTTQSR